MSGNRLRVHGVLSLILMLSMVPMQSCGVAAPTNSRPFRRMDGSFDNRLHTIANEWAVAMRRESRHHVDVY